MLHTLRAQLASLQTRYSDNHPDVIATKASIEQLERDLSDEDLQGLNSAAQVTNPAYISLVSELQSTRMKMANVKQSIEEYKRRAGIYQNRIEATPHIEGAYRSLMLERDNMQAKVDDLLKKLMESQVAQGLEQAQKGERFTIIDPPQRPSTPHKPNRMAIFLVGVVLALGVGVTMVALKESIDTSFKSPEELKLFLKAPVLSVLPVIGTAAERAQARKRKVRGLVLAGLGACVVVAIFLVHTYVMPLDTVWMKVQQRIALLI
jgi:uncharacterized protein involved in exopolysaccharide biosynthesis